MGSENGWEPPRAGADILEWVRIPGAEHVSLQFMKGPPSKILRAYAADYHAYIEPLRDHDSASFTPTNSVPTSNHLNGTAMDLNWQLHPFKVNYAGFDDAKIARMRDLLAFYNMDGLQIVFWAQDWRSPKDSMHHQMGYGTWNNPITDKFIRERIRPDGFSTYKRGGAPQPPPPAPATGLTAQTLAQAMGNRDGVDYAALLQPYRKACMLIGAQGNLNRLAMFAAQIGHESGGLRYMEEIASGAAYEGRSDLGNVHPGDGVRYKGRGPLQITGRHNYGKLSEWAFANKLVPSPTFFVDQPAQLATTTYGFLGAVWYWTVARPKINQMCDAGDLDGVTRAINGGLNRIADRRQRWDRARGMGLAALDVTGGTPPPAQGEDELSAEAERMIREMHAEWSAGKLGPTRSFFAQDQQGVESPLGFLYNIDANVWNQQVTWGYLLGVQRAEEFVHRVAETGVAPASWAGSLDDRWLAQWGQQWCQGLIGFRDAIHRGLNQPPVQGARPVEVQPADEPAPLRFAPSVAAPSTTGQVIGQAYDALEALTSSGVLSDAEEAPINALVKILQSKSASTQGENLT